MDNVKLSEKVKVYGAARAKVLTPGKEYDLHPLHAKTLIAKGEATEKKETKK